MVVDGRQGIPLTLLAGALIILGIAWGAGTQKETFLGNQLEEAGEAGSDLAALTGFFVGLGVALLLFTLGTVAPRKRSLLALTGGISAWFLVALIQISLPNYAVLPELGVASILQSNLLIDSTGSPTVLLPVLSLGILLMAGIAWSGTGVGRSATRKPSIDHLRRDHLGIVALAVPMLMLTAAGLVLVMLELPADMEGIGLVTLLHPLGAAGCILLAVTLGLRANQLARLQHNPDETWPVMESWRVLNRIDIAGIVSLAMVAVLSSFLPSEPATITSAGPTLGFTPRSHGQAVFSLAVVLVPLHMIHRRIGDQLPTARMELQDSPPGVRRDAWVFLGLMLVAAVAGVFTTFISARPLLPWFVALLPASFAAAILGRPASSALVRLTTAWTMWGIGNTIFASYDASTYPDLEFLVHPGVLALWRMGAAAMVAWVVYDLLRASADDQPARVVIPLSLAAATGVALVVLLELPLNVWAEPSIGANKVAVGSLLMSQQIGVRVVMHLFASTCALGASLALARLMRPDWFRRKGRTTTAKRGAPSAA